MTNFRSIEQIASDFSRLDPRFTQITDLSTLQGLLTDDRFGEAALYASGSGPVLYDLGILNGPEWAGVRQFLDSRLVSTGARSELQQLQRDLQAADTNGDHILNNQELVRFAQTHTDRWPNVAIFRNAAEIFLNRLSGYLVQTNLDQQQVSRLWGVMNHLARENDRLGVAQDRRGTVYGLSLQGFPSEDRNNSPSLIRRAMEGTLTPQELAAVHHVLETQMSEGQYNFQNGAPLSPVEIGILGQILDRAAAEGHTLHGMTVVTGEAETQLFAERNAAAQRCLEGTTAALRSPDQAGLQRAFTDCATDMARLEGQNPDRIGVHALLMRAYTGDLSAAETALLRTWMQQEASSLGLTGTWEGLGRGAVGLFQSIARDPGHFIARNGAFIGGVWLYRRLLLRNAFENRLSQSCGGPVANPRDAYRQYERYLRDQMQGSPVWRRLLNQLVRNPRRDSLLGRIGTNFLVTFSHLAAFNAVAAQKDTGNLAVDIATDLPLIALFEGLDTFDALNRSSIANFARANPGLCRPQAAAEPAPVTAPAPEAAAQPESQSQMSFIEEPLMSLMPDYSQMICPMSEAAPSLGIDPELANAFEVLEDSRALVSDGPSASGGSDARPYVTLDQISVDGTASVSGNTAPLAMPGATLRIPNLAPILEGAPFGPRMAPAVRFR